MKIIYLLYEKNKCWHWSIRAENLELLDKVIISMGTMARMLLLRSSGYLHFLARQILSSPQRHFDDFVSP